MRVDTLRERFVKYLQEKDLDTALLLDISLTVGQDSTLKYERIDKYRYTLLQSGELTGLIKECERIGVNLWFGIDRICIGYEHRSNMRLSAYENHSVRAGSDTAVNLGDRNISVLPEGGISGNQEDRKLDDEQHGAAAITASPLFNMCTVIQKYCPHCGISLPSFEGSGVVQYTCSCGKTVQVEAHLLQEFKVSFTG